MKRVPPPLTTFVTGDNNGQRKRQQKRLLRIRQRWTIVTSIVLLLILATMAFYMDYILSKGLMQRDVDTMLLPQGPIPKIMWFTYKHNILLNKTPALFYNNVMRTIQMYRNEWNDMNAPVTFLVDENCTTLLRDVDRREGLALAKAFATEERGDIRADLCRLAALYLYGGYYFDVDLEVIQALRLHPEVSFSTVDSNYKKLISIDSWLGPFFFQAFLASIPRHPVIRKNLHIMMENYILKNRTRCWRRTRVLLGPCTLYQAWKHTPQRGNARILKEMHLQKHRRYKYPNITQRGQEEACHWVVHDPKERQVYFYSRLLGTEKCTPVNTSVATAIGTRTKRRVVS